MARPSKGLSEARLLVRLPHEDRRRVERIRELMARRAGGVTIDLSAVVREALSRGCDSLERELARK